MLEPTLTQRAIKSALNQDWKEAVKLNCELLQLNQEDVETLNRLAYAYLKSGNLPSAKNSYKKVLKIDKYNPIATKNLKWITNLTKSDIHKDLTTPPTPTIFLEEPGKTKIVTLIHPAPAKILCNFMTAQKVLLVIKKRTIEVRDHHGIYIGVLPDDIAHRLRSFINNGNLYDVYIKNIEKNNVVVFIREIKQGKKYINFPSFPVSFTNSRSLTHHPEPEHATDVAPIQETP